MIESFVDISEIDPIYYDKSYYVTPEGAEKVLLCLEKPWKAKAKSA